RFGGSMSENTTVGWRSRRLPLILLFFVLLSILGVLGYLKWRHRANEEHRIGPPELPSAATLDPDVAARPGVAELHKLGGRVEFDATISSKPITRVFLTSTKATDADLALVRPWNTVRHLDLSGTKITDAGLRQLQDLAALVTLQLSFTGIKGEGLSVVAKLPNLETLDLSKTQLSDASLGHLKDVKTLQTLI